MIFWAKYNTQTTFSFPLVKRGVVDLAVSADYTPAATDSALSKDQGSFADTTNTVAAVGGSPTRSATGWKITLTGAELTAAQVDVQVIDAATKAIEDQFLTIYTYGNASAKFAGDWSDLVRLGLTALPNAAAEAAGGLFTRGTGAGQINQDANGRVDANVKAVSGTLQTAGDLKATMGTPAGVSLAADLAEIEAETDGIAAIPTTTPLTAQQIATGVWQDITVGDFTVAGSIGKSIMGGNTLGSPLNPGIRKNVALPNFEIEMTDSTNHNPVTGLMVSVTRSIDGGAFGAGTIANIVEIGNGWYAFDFGAGDLNGTVIGVRATATGADDLDFTIKTSP